MPAPTPFDVIYSPFEAGVLPAFAVDPDEGELIPVSFNPTYMPYVVGAIKALVQPALYKGVPNIELQLNRANLLLSMFNSPNAYQRPFYDDDEQMDDSSLPVAPWYEEVSDWIITLFLAVTVTPGAAIVYKTTIPRLRLAFRTGNIGTIVRVLIDDIEVWTGNTYSATEGMLETVIDVPALPGLRRSLLPGEHILKVVHAGEAGQKLEVVRGDIRPQVYTKLRMSALCGTLQASYDNGATWFDLVDVNQCATVAANAAIDTALANGAIAAPGQQSAGGSVPANECHTYNVTLRGNSRWHCPVPVTAGYSIAVTNARGGWSDAGNILATWGCPDGTQYTLGGCGDTLITIPSDPLQSAHHLRLIGYCNGIYMDMYNTVYTVPNGTPNSDFFLQANDGDLTGNDGEISLTVTVCNYAQWCNTFDFTVSAGPFHAYNGGEQWVSGVGWQTQTDGSNQIGGPQLDVQSPFYLSEMTIDYEDTASDVYNNQVIGRTGGGEPYTYALLPDQSIGAHTYTWTLSAPTLSTQVHASLDCAGSSTRNTVKGMTLRGIGVNPFGVSNC